jgi:hypothetical protein
MSKEQENREVFLKIQRNVFEDLSFTQLRNSNLHMLHEVLGKGTEVRAHRQKIPVERETVLVFADDAPLLNWGHPCRYILFDAATAEPYREIAAQFPPFMIKTPENFKPFHEPVKFAPQNQFVIPRPILTCPIRFPIGERYAVLYAGASNNRHTNDLEFLYRTLRHQYGFKDDHIYALNYDGTLNYNGGPPTTWPGDNTPYQMPVKGAGTKADLDAVLDELKKRLRPNDLLLIHTNNHGGNDGPGKSYLVTYSGPDYFAQDFANKLAELPKYDTLMVMMEQCFAGGFNAPILSKSTAAKTTVASAAIETQSSIGGPFFDPFARDWIGAMAGHNPNGASLAFNPDTDGNGRIYAEEAFAYADAVHDPFDTPNYSETSEAAGDTFLGQRYITFWWFCPLVTRLLEPHYEALPIPEFYDRVHTQLEPVLRQIEQNLDKTSGTLRNEVEGQIKRAIDDTFKVKATAA